MSDHILVEQDGPIATVVFNRPKMRNAISLAMGLGDALEDLSLIHI